jgi:hypothetical protein
MIIISSSLVLSQTGTEGANNPVIGWHNLANTGNVLASYNASGYPATNAANPSTDQVWKSSNSSVGQAFNIFHDAVEQIDYVGVAQHNFGSAGISVKLQAYNSLSGGNPVWFDLTSYAIPADDQPIIFRFTPQSLIGVRLNMVPDGVAPSIGVVYVGKLLVLPRPIYVGHTPITLSRDTVATTAQSQSGRFLGRVILERAVSTAVQLVQLPRGWYRDYMKPFTAFAEENPFFFAWRPQEFPDEVGYVWLTKDPKPVNSRPEGFVDVELAISGIVS